VVSYRMARAGFEFSMASQACHCLFDLKMRKSVHESFGFMIFMVKSLSDVLAGSGTRFPN